MTTDFNYMLKFNTKIKKNNNNDAVSKTCKLKRFGKVIAILIAKFVLKLALKMRSYAIFGI